jgi:putative DNA primase/helicase
MCSRKEAQVTRMPADKPDLIVDPGDLPATARELRDLLAASGRFFDRGIPVKIVPDANGRAPTATELTPNKVVIAAHDFCRPVREQGDKLVRVTLPQRVGRMYLDLAGEWDLPPLAGITTAPVLAPDGTVRTAEGYDPMTQLWCARVPPLHIPEHPRQEETEAALRVLRQTVRSFPFADAPRIHDQSLGAEVVDLDQPPYLDESTFLVGLVTAICRPELWLAPGFLVRAPEISGAGSGKGLLMRSVCAIAFGRRPTMKVMPRRAMPVPRKSWATCSGANR